MSGSYSDIMKILRDVEKELKLPENMLKQIYDTEKNVVFMGTRTNIYNDLRTIIASNLDKQSREES